MTEPRSVDEIVHGSWKNYRLATSESPQDGVEADEWFWAWEAVDGEVHVPTPRTFELLLALVGAATDDEALGYVGAGPIEDLVNLHGATFVSQIEEAARRDRRFRDALSGVRVSSKLPNDVPDRLAVFIDPSGFIHD